jgi:hypothetical protein
VASKGAAVSKIKTEPDARLSLSRLGMLAPCGRTRTIGVEVRSPWNIQPIHVCYTPGALGVIV